MGTQMTAKQILAMWRRRLQTKSQRELAASLEISEAYLSDILAGRRDIGPKILEKLGLERVATYRRKNGT